MKDLSNLTITQYQSLIKQLVVKRGFSNETVPEVFTLLVEEVGELAKAIRKHNGQKIDSSAKQREVEDELADVFWMLIDLANRLGINLGAAFAKKEDKNQHRNWQ